MNMKQANELDALYKVAELKIKHTELKEILKEVEAKNKAIDKFAEYLKDKVKKDEQNLIDHSIMCTHCGAKFVPINPIEKEATNREVVYSDAGYGDEDEVADVTRLVKTATCPSCHKETFLESHYLRESNRRKLHGGN